ncbi:MAG: response regulator [Phycisphaerales bacterium]|jgi:two-component system OmpR family response regulator|nr:response regulator [Phycisphaerales bacterium]
MNDAARPISIIIADDEAPILEILTRKFAAEGFEVRSAYDGQAALQLARERAPDVVVTDLQMPLMSGLELAQALRSDRNTHDVPVLLLTARGYLASESVLQQTNIRMTHPKPFSARKVVELARGIVEASSMRGAA